MNVIHNLFEGVDIKVDLTPNNLRLLINGIITMNFSDINLNIKESLKQNENINMTFSDINMQCYGKLIFSRSVGSTRSVTVGECKNLTMFEYYIDTFYSKVGTTRTVTVGDVKNITLYNYYNGTL